MLERGRVLNSSGDSEQARPLFVEAWELALAHGEDALAVDAAHMEGIVEDPPRQLDWHLEALDLAERSPDDRARRWRDSLCNNLGWIHHDQGRYPEALDAFERALACREVEGREPEFRIARRCVARAQRSLGRLDEAVAIQRALLAELDTRDEVDGYVFEKLAECLLALGRTAEAGEYAARAYAELAKDPWLSTNEPDRLRRLAELGGP